MENPIKVLILEDNPDDLILLTEGIEASQEMVIEIVSAERLAEALELLKKNPVDAAILDLQLPDSFGLDTFTRFHKEFPDIPVVIMTGTNDYQIAVEAVQKGAQDYLIKGVPSSSTIVRTLRYAIERQRLTSELKAAKDEINTLRGIIPICCHCKKIRDIKGYWNELEAYIEAHSDASFSHGMCDDCINEVYGEEDWYIAMKKNEKTK